MGSGIKESALAKIQEYHERLMAAQGGNPLKAGDTVENLIPDFKRLAKIDWTPDFDIAEYKNSRDTKTGTNEIAPVVFDQIKDNPNLGSRGYDASLFELKNENGKVVEYFAGRKNTNAPEVIGELQEVAEIGRASCRERV